MKKIPHFLTKCIVNAENGVFLTLILVRFLIEIGVKIGYFHTFPKQKYRKD